MNFSRTEQMVYKKYNTCKYKFKTVKTRLTIQKYNTYSLFTDHYIYIYSIQLAHNSYKWNSKNLKTFRITTWIYTRYDLDSENVMRNCQEFTNFSLTTKIIVTYDQPVRDNCEWLCTHSFYMNCSFQACYEIKPKHNHKFFFRADNMYNTWKKLDEVSDIFILFFYTNWRKLVPLLCMWCNES